MRRLILVASAALAAGQECADEEAFMQGRVERSNSPEQLRTTNFKTKEERTGSANNLLELTTRMIKAGVTPDVVTFVDSTKQEIQDDVLPVIEHEHGLDQQSINDLLAQFAQAISDLEEEMANDAPDASRLGAIAAHQECRSGQALTCARHRRCQEELEELWRLVTTEELRMREIHGHIHDGFCVNPPDYINYDPDPFNWAQTMPYPVLDWPQEVTDFWYEQESYHDSYIEQLRTVRLAWERYNTKVVECADLEVTLDAAVEECDELQDAVQSASCEYSSHNRDIRRDFAARWHNLLRQYNDEVTRVTQNEFDRKREWENLHIVICLLTHIHDAVEDSINTGAPCPTEESDPDGVRTTIEQCHIVTESMTEHLTIVYGEPPPAPPLPPYVEPPCTPDFMVSEQWTFSSTLQATFTASLEAEGLMDYFTTLSEAGWPGCAAPKVCTRCQGMWTVQPDETRTEASQVCNIDEEYLLPGQSNLDTFRCLDGYCLSTSGRCNGVAQCGDESDELGCGSQSGTPAFLSESEDCPSEVGLAAGHGNDVTFRCADGQCTKRAALCNGHNNCGDGSDELHCHGPIRVTVVASSGRTVTVETLPGTPVIGHSPSLLQVASSSSSSDYDPYAVFHDREYTITDYGDFTGATQIKYSNDDKETDFEHVMIKLTTKEPYVVVIVKLQDKILPWLEAEGYVPVEKTGLVYEGTKETKHTEWSGDLTWQSFNVEDVWGKYFDAGVISLPGNNGGDGSFLVFLERP